MSAADAGDAGGEYEAEEERLNKRNAALRARNAQLRRVETAAGLLVDQQTKALRSFLDQRAATAEEDAVGHDPIADARVARAERALFVMMTALENFVTTARNNELD